MNERFNLMKTVRIKVDLKNPESFPQPRINRAVLDATTEKDIKRHQKQDEAEAMRDAAQFTRTVREQLGLTQQEFSLRIEVPIETIRNWEQGKRTPTGAAKTLLKLLYRSPKAALAALK